jgi:hypothetical protein
MPTWAKVAIDAWPAAAGFTEGFVYASTWYAGGARVCTRPQAGGAFSETGRPS